MFRWMMMLIVLASACKSDPESMRPNAPGATDGAVAAEENEAPKASARRSRPDLSDMDRWSEVLPVEIDGGNPSETTTVVASDGTVHAFWSQGGLWTNRFQDGKWVGASRLEPDTSASAFGAAAGPDGTVWVAFGKAPDDDALPQLRVRQYTAGTWAEPVDVPDAVMPAHLALAVDSDGRVAVVWVRIGEGVFAAMRDADSKWSAPDPIGKGTGPGVPGPGPDVIAAKDGFHVAWAEDGVVRTRRHDGAAWGPVHDLHDRQLRFAPQLALAGEQLFIAFDSDAKIWSARYSTADGWTPVEHVGIAEQTTRGFGLATHPDGRANVVWSAFKDRQSSGNTQIWANSFDGEWGTPQPIQNLPETTRPPAVGADAHGNTFVAYGQNDPRLPREPTRDGHALRVTFHSAERGWSKPVDLGFGEAKSIAVRPDGELVVLFHERFDSQLWDLKSRAFAPIR